MASTATGLAREAPRNAIAMEVVQDTQRRRPAKTYAMARIGHSKPVAMVIISIWRAMQNRWLFLILSDYAMEMPVVRGGW